MATSTFNLAGAIDGATVDGAVTVASGTYNTAGVYQTALQTAIDDRLTSDDAAAGSVQARVTDQGGACGASSVQLEAGER